MSQNIINRIKIFSAEAIAKSGVAWSPVIKLKDYRPEGYLRLYLALTGDGTCKLEWKVSADEKNYVTPSGYDNEVCSGFTKASGSHSIEVGDTGLIRSVSGMTEINGLTATIASTTATTATTDIDASGFTAYTSGGTVRIVDKAADADTVITGITAADPAVITVNRGRDIFVVYAPPMPFLKIKASETGGSSAIAISAWLVIV